MPEKKVEHPEIGARVIHHHLGNTHKGKVVKYCVILEDDTGFRWIAGTEDIEKTTEKQEDTHV